MADRRRIVVDTSAIVPAFYPDGIAHTDRRAKAILSAIECRAVIAFAPDMLRAEVFKRAARLLEQHPQAEKSRPDVVADIERQWMRFLDMNLVYTPASRLSTIAWEAVAHYHVPAPDSWFVACAVHHDAELWYSHPPEDRAGDHARAYGITVRYLSEQPFGA